VVLHLVSMGGRRCVFAVDFHMRRMKNVFERAQTMTKNQHTRWFSHTLPGSGFSARVAHFVHTPYFGVYKDGYLFLVLFDT
jgi:hypothetical protein